MQNDPNTVRECPKCGKAIKRTAYICPHCRESLAEYDQRKWERESPLPEPKEVPVPVTTRSFKSTILHPVSLFFLIAVVFGLTLILYPSQEKEGGYDAEKVTAAGMEPQAVPPNRYEMVDNPAPPSSAEMPPPAEQDAVGEELEAHRKRFEEGRARYQKIKSVADDIFSKLKEEEAITTDILYLKSGRELHCTIIEDLGTQLKVSYRGVTTTIEKTDIDRMKHRSQQSADMQMQRMALEQATRIVDNGLVEYKGEWITPEEKEIRMQADKLELEQERLELQAAASAQKQQAQKPAIPRMTAPPVTIGSGIDFSSVVITEGRGFGDIIVGDPRCTKKLVKSKLGEPNIEKEHMLDYDWKYGLRFIFASDADVLIEITLNRRFKGKLSSGISMSSTQEDVFAAYGAPVGEEQVHDLFMDYRTYANRTLYQKDLNSRMWYRDLGLEFVFEEGKVKNITVIRI